MRELFLIITPTCLIVGLMVMLCGLATLLELVGTHERETPELRDAPDRGAVRFEAWPLP